MRTRHLTTPKRLWDRLKTSVAEHEQLEFASEVRAGNEIQLVIGCVHHTFALRQVGRYKESFSMKFLSAAIIVTSGVALVSSSQWCAASIMELKPVHTIDIAHRGVTIGICIIICGLLGWGYAILSRTDS